MTRAPLTLRRKFVYATLATLLGVLVILGGLEATLRLAGYGYSPHFVRRARDADGRDVWRENRWCTAPFFTPELVRRPQPFVLPVTKPARSYRVVVLGSSAAMGDPEASFSLARMLQVLLRDAYPDVTIDVVNAGITAINSHLVRSIAGDCTSLQPDLLVVYEGNNEVIGPYGPTGVLAPFLRSSAAIRSSMWLQGTRLGQLTRSSARRFGGKDVPDDWGGMKMFLSHEIQADDPRLAAVRDRFRENLQAIAGIARDAKASLVLCTVLTNQRDLPPFLSRHRASLPSEQRRAWDDAFAAGGAAERSGDLAAAERAYATCAGIDDPFAELAYRRGQIALARSNDRTARELLQRALDLDGLRFRTDSKLNEIVREVASAEAGCSLVDVDRALRAGCPHGIPGDELLYEHVHLTFRGTYEIATALLPAIAADLSRRGLAHAHAPAVLPLDEVRQRLAFTVYEQAMIGLQLLNRFHAAPFSGLSDNTRRIEAWERRAATADRLLSQTGATEALQTIYAAALAHSPHDWVLARNAGAMLVARGQAAEAIPLLEKSRRLIPDDADTLVALALAHQGLSHAREAEELFNEVRRIEPRHPLLPK